MQKKTVVTILKSIFEVPLFLGLDEFDRLFSNKALCREFLGLLRAWHERGKVNETWAKLRIAISHATEIYPVSDINSSPFNVGLAVDLPEFTQKQVLELVKRHGLNLDRGEVEELMAMVGGHPYLVRRALYHIAQKDLTLTELLAEAPTDDGIYGDHLRLHFLNLQQNPDLAMAFRQVINSDSPVILEPTLEFKLRGMGLVNFQGNSVVPRFDLYRLYFQHCLDILPKTSSRSVSMETSSRTLLWQERNTKVSALCTSTPWNLPFDALVIPVGYHGGLGQLGAAFQESLAIDLESSRWLSQSIKNEMKAKNMKSIRPENPLLFQLPLDIVAQFSSPTDFNSERFVICASSESGYELSVANTSLAFESVVSLVVERRFRHIVVSPIGIGVNQLPLNEVAIGMLRAINNVLKSRQPKMFEDITIVCNDEDKMAAIVRIARQLTLNASEVDSQTSQDKAGFFTSNGIKKLVQNSQYLTFDEDIYEAMQVYRTRRQRTWLVFTNKQVFFLLDDDKTRAKQKIIQYQQKLVDSIPVKTREKSDTTGSFQLGKSVFWLYSINILGAPTLARSHLESFIKIARA